MNLGPVEMLLIGAVAVVPLVAVILLARKRKGWRPETFAAAHGFRLTAINRPVVVSYLNRSLRFRLVGAVLGVLIPFGTEIPGIEMVGGYLFGALAAELTHARLQRSAQAAASLSPRVLGDYLTPGILRAMRATAAAGVALMPLFFVLPQRPSLAQGLPGYLFLAGALVIAAEIAVELMLRLIVRRPQPAEEPDLVAADDAIRAASIHASAGAGLAVMLLLAAVELWLFGLGTDVQMLRWGLPVLAAGSILSAFAVWARYGHDTDWRVKRPEIGEARA